MSEYIKYLFSFLAGLLIAILLALLFFISREVGLTVKEHVYLGIAILTSGILLGQVIAILSFWELQKKIYPNGYRKLSASAFLRIESDGKHSYEFYKHIECKKAILFKYSHGFYWGNGSEDPIIKTELQRLLNVEKNPKNENHKIVWLGFPRALLYNQSTVINFEMIFQNYKDDIGPFLEFVIDTPIEYITWHIEFADGYDKINQRPARILIKEGNYDFRELKEIEPAKFDKSTRSYRKKIADPVIGATYRLDWGDIEVPPSH